MICRDGLRQVEEEEEGSLDRRRAGEVHARPGLPVCTCMVWGPHVWARADGRAGRIRLLNPSLRVVGFTKSANAAAA